MKSRSDIGIPLILLAIIIGFKFPDFDMITPGLSHRDILTHSAIPAGIVLAYATKYGYKYVGIAFSIALGFHLSADLFPKSWTGFALIRITFIGRSIGDAFSFGWLLLNSICCFYLGYRKIYSDRKYNIISAITISFIILIIYWKFIEDKLLTWDFLISMLIWVASIIAVHLRQARRPVENPNSGSAPERGTKAT